MSQVFKYAIDKKLAPFWLPFGVKPSKDGVTITDDGRFVATFGLLRVATPLDNVDEAHITTGYRWWTAIGARGSALWMLGWMQTQWRASVSGSSSRG